MKVYVCLVVAMLAMAMPAHALLGAKLALLGALKGSIGGGGGGYGNRGGYGGGYNYNRPVYTGYSGNHGWGQQSYGYGGYNGGYAGVYNGYNGYNNGGEQVVRVIKVIEEPQVNYENYARGSAAASAVSSSSSSSGWLSAPVPGVQNVQVSAPAAVRTPVESVQISAPSPVPAPVQVIQPPSTPLYISRPIQYPVQQAVYQQPQALPQVNVVVDAEAQHVPAQTYGPPAPSSTYVASNSGNNGVWSSGPWKSGGIWESIGC